MRNWTYLQKNIALLVAGAFIALVAFVGAIRPTIQLRAENSRLARKVQQAQQASRETREIRRELQSLDSLLLQQDKNDQAVFDRVSQYAKTYDCLLKQIGLPHIRQEKEYSISTYSFDIQGDFHQLLQALYAIEQNVALGTVGSVQMRQVEDRALRKDFLQLTVYLQTVRKNEAFS